MSEKGFQMKTIQKIGLCTTMMTLLAGAGYNAYKIATNNEELPKVSRDGWVVDDSMTLDSTYFEAMNNYTKAIHNLIKSKYPEKALKSIDSEIERIEQGKQTSIEIAENKIKKLQEEKAEIISD